MKLFLFKTSKVKHLCFSFFIALFLLLSNFKIQAQDSESDFIEIDKRKDFGLSISPYAWLAGQATDVGGEKLRQSFNDLSSLTNTGFQLNVVGRYKRLLLTFDGTFANLGAGSSTELLKLDFELKQTILDNKVGYIIFDKIEYPEDGVIAGWSIEGNIGGKYWKNDVLVDYSIQIGDLPPITDQISEPQSWWDLMLGVKARIILSKSVYLGLAGNIGGFGIGNSSKVSWDLNYVNTFKVSNLILVTAGYRTFKYRRVDGEGANTLKTNVAAFGPLLGVSFVL